MVAGGSNHNVSAGFIGYSNLLTESYEKLQFFYQYPFDTVAPS
ncbi:hypothetical Protein YC6258_01549 [Gynuella sunshinyii YC6258]|uniref:Uncharacterized protein n=1 Tax=Gynuella sunshinyii YC6258 TaxID=1445510 RepID=A0A0C5VG62_9GAMM|nr:hypothetical Protein YC6258_01549 [Gynuella sunshinyii YC6258]